MSLAIWLAAGLVLTEALAVPVARVHAPSAMAPAAAVTLGWWLLIALVFIAGAALLDTPDGTPVDHYGLPNGLTALRAWACAPLLVVAVLSLPDRLGLLLWVFVGGAVGMLDAVDGIVARRYGPVTVLGKAMDPFGDALFFHAQGRNLCAAVSANFRNLGRGSCGSPTGRISFSIRLTFTRNASLSHTLCVLPDLRT